MNPGTNNLYFLEVILCWTLNCLDRPYKARPVQVFRKKKSDENWSFRPKKSLLHPIKFISQTKLITDPGRLFDDFFFYVKHSDFGNVKYFLSYTQKI